MERRRPLGQELTGRLSVPSTSVVTAPSTEAQTRMLTTLPAASVDTVATDYYYCLSLPGQRT